MPKKKSKVVNTSKKYSFSKFLTYDTDDKGKRKINGPISPMAAVATVAKELETKLNGAIRVNNLQPFSESNTYDHILMVKRYVTKGERSNMYALAIDFGDSIIPAHMWFDNEPIEEMVVSDSYTIELARMNYHAANVECMDATPILVLTKQEFANMCKDAEEKNMFKVEE